MLLKRNGINMYRIKTNNFSCIGKAFTSRTNTGYGYTSA